MKQVSLILLSCSLVACSDGGTTADSGTTDSAAVTYPSSFTEAKYSAKSLTVLPETEGFDLDGDGEINNKLPTLLALVDPFTTEDMSLEGVNTTVSEMQAEGQLVLLLDALYQAGELRIDLLLSARNEDSGALEMDSSSYGADGTPSSRFTGAFEDATHFDVLAPTADLPFPVVAGDPPVQIPLVDAVIDGELFDLTGGQPDTGDWTAGLGVMVGALPVQGLVDQVVQKIVPPEEPVTGGEEDTLYYNSDDYLGMSRDDFMVWVTDLLNENVADLWLEDDSRAVSAALSWEVQLATEWPD